jgi:predicted NAD-dependent protein-ADP-ribosyltransferase YbiA (DUF1768 family)
MAITFYTVNRPYGAFFNFSPHGFTPDGRWWPTRVCLANRVGRVETAEKPFLDERLATA